MCARLNCTALYWTLVSLTGSSAPTSSPLWWGRQGSVMVECLLFPFLDPSFGDPPTTSDSAMDSGFYPDQHYYDPPSLLAQFGRALVLCKPTVVGSNPTEVSFPRIGPFDPSLASLRYGKVARIPASLRQ